MKYYKERNNFILRPKIYLLKMTGSHAKMRLKSAPQNLNFVMAKAVSKCDIIDCSYKCPCTFPHSCGC